MPLARLMTLLLLCLPTALLAQTNLLDDIRDQLANEQAQRGEFVQHKQLQGFEQPLTSSGRFYLDPGRGIRWQSLEPFASTLIITSDAVEEIADGERSTLYQAKSGQAQSVSTLLFALLSADVERLQTLFTIEASQLEDEHWQLRLRPLGNGQLAEMIARIELRGSDHVQQVDIQQMNGDSTLIELQAVQAAEPGQALDVTDS